MQRQNARIAERGDAGPLTERLDRVAGSLPRKAPGARGLTQLILNPECDEILVIRAARVEPGVVSQAAYGGQDEKGSKISFGVGMHHESRLLREGASAIVEVYRVAGILDGGPQRVVDVRAQAPGSAPADMEARIRLTHQHLRDRLSGDPLAPSILLHALCRLPALGGEVLIEPDVLVLPGGAAPLRLGEIKSLRDRGSRTNVNDVARARGQAAAEVLAVRSALREIGLSGSEVERLMPPEGDLLLRRRIGRQISRRPVQIGAEIAALQQVLAGAEDRLREALLRLPAEASLADPSTLESIPHHFTGACHTFCPLAQRCEARARALGDPAVLGDEVAEALGPIGSIPRLIAMAAGDEQPANEAEARVLRDYLLTQSTLHSLDVRPHAL